MEDRYEARERRRRRHRTAAAERAAQRLKARDARGLSGIWLGIILILVGAILAFERLDVITLDSPWRLWPLALVATGIEKLVTARELGPANGGLWLVISGAWLLVRNLRLFGPGFSSSWPLLLVGFGVALVWDSLLKGRDREREPQNGGGAV